jgi:hypothetical protein
MAKIAEKERFVVAPGCSFVGNKRAYNAGDEIDEEAFGDTSDFQKFLTGKNPKIIKAPPEEKTPAENTGNAGGIGGTPVNRKQPEEAVVAKKLGKPEDLATLSDDELKQLLGDAK